MRASTTQKRILIVDDHEDFADLVRRVLEIEGAEVAVARDGAYGLAMAADGFDLILMDLHLPGIDGLEVTRRLRARGFDGPILAVSAQAMRENVEAALAAGCNEYLSKPLSLAHLKEVVGRYL
jgi:CheY-like chemotaxis protein